MNLSLAQLAALFTTPALAAAGAVCVAIPVVIHLLSRTRRTRAQWGAMRFLRLAYKKQKRKLRMEKWLLLLTRCAIMAIAGLALAGPLLSGAWGGMTPGSGGRTVYVILEVGLSTRAAVGDGTRFDQLRTTAMELIASLSPNNAVQLWTTSRPQTPHPATPTPTLDHAKVREALDNLQPGHARSTLAEVLQQVGEDINTQAAAARRPPVVALLSDFARGADYLEEALPAELATLGQRATLIATRPDVGSGNVQIQALRPRRSLILAPAVASAPGSFLGNAANQSGTAAVSVEVVLRRFDDTTSAAAGTLRLFLTPPGGKALPAVTRPVSWSAGQTTATLSIDLPIHAPASTQPSSTDADVSTDISRGGGMWTITAALVGEAGLADALREDDQRFAVVQVRPQLHVGVIDDGTGGSANDTSAGASTVTSGGGGGLNPAAFVRAALSPEQTGQRFAVATDTVLPATLDTDRLDNLDAVIVLRPDTLGATGWAALGEFAQAGGLVWVFPSADDGVAARDWFGLMRSAMNVDWQLDDGRAVVEAPADQPMRLNTDARPPAALLLLSADWSALLGPVRLSRSLNLTTPQSADAWITLADPGKFNTASGNDASSVVEQTPERTVGDAGGNVFLASASVGEGRLLLSSVAVDAAWTNLPTKPVFPALLHDALRGVLGSRSSNDDTVVGDAPTLGRSWAGATRLQQVNGEADVLVSEGEVLSPITQPGVYGETAGSGTMTSGVRLAVNVPADAGDVRAVSEPQLAAWLDGLGSWDYLEADNPGSVLAEAERRSNLGWALLWVLLVLVVVEMLLARWFSHAAASQRGRADEPRSKQSRINLKRISPFHRAAGFLPFLMVFTFGYLLVAAPSAEAGVWEDFLGLREVRLADASAVGWRFALPGWAWVLIVGASLGVAWWSYRKLLGPTWARVGLACLRGLLLVLIAVLLAGPEVVRTDETVEEDVLLVLIDRSASMTIADTPPAPGNDLDNSSDDDADRVGSGLISRESALREALSSQGQVFGEQQLGRGRQVTWLGFGSQAFEMASPLGADGVEALGDPSDQTTALRTALEAALRRGAGRPISGIVLMSDGQSPEDTGADLLAKLEQQSVRVYSVPLGAARLPLDLVLARVESPTTAFINDGVPVTVVVEQPSQQPGETPLDPSRITVRLIDTKTQDIVDEKTLEGVGLGQPLRLEGRSSLTGEMPWAVEVIYDPPNGGERELNPTNNVEALVVNMIDRPIRVLYIEGYPRWEYRYLKNMLIREKSIDSSIMLLSADRAFAQEGDTPITRLPSGPEEWRRYDVVIVGDVPAEAMSAEQRKQLHDLVSQRGAGVLWMAGPGSMPTTYAATMLSDLLPMRDPEAVSLLPWARASVRPTPLAQTLSVLQLRSAGSDGEATPDWPEDLPGLRWVQNLGQLKPSAEVLAGVGSMDMGNPSPGEMEGDIFGSGSGLQGPPLITRLRFGAGQSLYVATDETWRWRYARGELYFEQFWVQLVRMLGRAAATRSDEPVRLAVSSRSTPVGGTVVVDLDIEDAAILSRDLPSVRVAVRRAGDVLDRDLAEFELHPTPGTAPGIGSGRGGGTSGDGQGRRYSSPWLASVSGELELVVTDPALSGLGLRLPLDVIASDDELRRAEADVPRLVRLAEATGGRVVPLDDLAQLVEPGVVRNLARKSANDVAEPIWNSALALALVVMLITLEWLGRKWVRLV